MNDSLYSGAVFRVVLIEHDGTPYPYKIKRRESERDVAACPTEIDAMMVWRDLEIGVALLHQHEWHSETHRARR